MTWLDLCALTAFWWTPADLDFDGAFDDTLMTEPALAGQLWSAAAASSEWQPS